MCAMMPMFLQRSNGTSLATFLVRFPFVLPAVVRESLVGLRHAVHVFFLLYRGAAAVGRVQQLVGELVHHALFAASSAVGNQPADGQRSAPVLVDFDRNLVVRAANSPRFHFQQRLDVLHCLLEQLQRFVAALLLQLTHGFVEDAFRRALFPRPHHRIDELGDQGRAKHRIRLYFFLDDMSFSWHVACNSCWRLFAFSTWLPAARPYLLTGY